VTVVELSAAYFAPVDYEHAHLELLRGLEELVSQRGVPIIFGHVA
jgi:hypothetical protein